MDLSASTHHCWCVAPCVNVAAEWYLDMSEFAAAFSPRTKAVILNTPHNPTGKVFSREELEDIACVIRAQPTDVVVVCDEVYENLTYDGYEHVHMATLPDM